MSDREPTPQLTPAKEVLKILRDPETALAKIKPRTINVDALETRLKPVDLSVLEFDDANSKDQFTLLNEFYKTNLFMDLNGSYVLKVESTKPNHTLTTYIMFDEYPITSTRTTDTDTDSELMVQDKILRLEANNFYFASDQKAVSVKDLLPPGFWQIEFDSEIREDGNYINFWVSNMESELIGLGLTFNSDDLTSILHEAGHLWADYLGLDPNSDSQFSARNTFYSDTDKTPLTADELSGIAEVSLSERLANMIARILSRRLTDSGFTVDQQTNWFDTLGTERDLHTYDEDLHNVVRNSTNNPEKYFASRKYRTGKV